MTLEEKIAKNAKIRERNLGRPAKLAADKPDTGVKILKKGAYYLIQDCAKITSKYLAHLAYSSLSDPIADLKGKFTKAEIIDFVGRATEEPHTQQLLYIILTDLGASAQYKNVTATKPASTKAKTEEIDLTYNDDEDVYGDYNDEGLEEAEEEVVTDEGAVDVNDSSGVIDLLINAFDAK
jgi:hypothetical protein